MKLLYLALTLMLVWMWSAHAAEACYLTWDAPTTDVSGNELLEGDIDAYRLYILNRPFDFIKGDSSQYIEILPVSDDVDPVTHIACDLTSWSSGKKAVVTAVSDFPNAPLEESDFSNVIEKVTPGRPGNAKQVKELPTS